MRYLSIYSLLIFCLSINACQVSDPAAAEQAPAAAATPVTAISIDSALLQEKIELNATAVFLLKNFVKANTTGYITSSNIEVGDWINRGQTLFVIKTKEAESLGKLITKLDTSFNFSGTTQVKSSASGYIVQLNHQVGDYVQDGESLAQLSDQSSFGFIMNLPYEYNQLLKDNKLIELVLPDERVLRGIISQTMPSVDSVSQTQRVLIKVSDAANIPENLIAKVLLVKKTAQYPSLPKEAVLSDEQQQNFWVMKMQNDSTAVRTPIHKGLETGSRVEIISPQFSPQDLILISGNYGLADTAKVRLIKE
ncbi:efflux RND transporter periplasmic adaptor subunit [Albibacterium bauzanense]|uniref:HlyD family secretion protein n=1 Tax=Albibacterium bauzanense TaxID=653929 RepID=A0A4R1M2E4_9SPHI|nr:HlyD family efflux transporter periplasmic adaptor subunit [Albibacterium bauzanense]TCK85382.1 HlyD family secretion protein [Albibacterium bauzanense]